MFKSMPMSSLWYFLMWAYKFLLTLYVILLAGRADKDNVELHVFGQKVALGAEPPLEGNPAGQANKGGVGRGARGRQHVALVDGKVVGGELGKIWRTKEKPCLQYCAVPLKYCSDYEIAIPLTIHTATRGFITDRCKVAFQ